MKMKLTFVTLSLLASTSAFADTTLIANQQISIPANAIAVSISSANRCDLIVDAKLFARKISAGTQFTFNTSTMVTAIRPDTPSGVLTLVEQELDDQGAVQLQPKIRAAILAAKTGVEAQQVVKDQLGLLINPSSVLYTTAAVLISAKTKTPVALRCIDHAFWSADALADALRSDGLLRPSDEL